jgi:hypothetical protein
MYVVTRWASWRRQLLTPALIALALGWSACRRQNAAPPPPPPPPVASAPAAPPPPPPPPKCESPEEQCTAEDSTRVEIGDSGIDYAPPLGWRYVKGLDHSRALESQGAAVVGFAVVPEESPNEVLAAAEKLRVALELDGVKVDKLKKRLKKSQQKLQGPHGEIDLWEITAHTQGGTTPALHGKGAGTALLARARVATEREVVVLGFVVEPDDEGRAALIMKAVESLAVKQ